QLRGRRSHFDAGDDLEDLVTVPGCEQRPDRITIQRGSHPLHLGITAVAGRESHDCETEHRGMVEPRRLLRSVARREAGGGLDGQVGYREMPDHDRLRPRFRMDCYEPAHVDEFEYGARRAVFPLRVVVALVRMGPGTVGGAGEGGMQSRVAGTFSEELRGPVC